MCVGIFMGWIVSRQRQKLNAPARSRASITTEHEAESAAALVAARPSS
jgi:hypothetical protein